MFGWAGRRNDFTFTAVKQIVGSARGERVLYLECWIRGYLLIAAPVRLVLNTKGEMVMALNPEDARPAGLSDQDRYERIRTWYQANVSRLALRQDGYGEHARFSTDYIHTLPPPESATPEQIADLFKQVRAGRLEWAYHESDGRYKMAAYAGVD